VGNAQHSNDDDLRQKKASDSRRRFTSALPCRLRALIPDVSVDTHMCPRPSLLATIG